MHMIQGRILFVNLCSFCRKYDKMYEVRKGGNTVLKEFLKANSRVLWIIFGAWLLLINLLGFLLMGVDKYKAKHERWRIKEKTLFLVSALGGSLGVWLGMTVFHHKTLHKKFTLGVPAIFIAETALLVWFLLWLAR